MGSPAIFLIVFLLEALLYGGGAILIREIARGAGRGWLAILGLGLAFGVLEEGLRRPQRPAMHRCDHEMAPLRLARPPRAQTAGAGLQAASVWRLSRIRIRETSPSAING